VPSPSALLAAAKAARAAPPAAGQGAPGVYPGIGMGGGWGGTYGNFLPRPAQDFTDGAFSPLAPVRPMPVDRPPDGSDRAMPRRWQYPVGWDLPSPPGTEGVKLCTFDTLRSLSRLYSVARACIQLLKSEIRGLEWDIVPTKDAAKSMRGDHRAMKDFGQRRAECIRFFKNPDPEYGSWSSWIDTLLEDVYAIDALSVFLRPSRVKGRGLMGSDLSALELISGETLRPLVDLHGSRPSPPSPAFQQFLFGVPRTDLMTIMAGADLTDELTRSQVREYRGDQMLYLPFTRATDTPYGSPPIEQALVPVMSGLSKQGYQLDYFREGSIPGLFISPGDAAMTPSQVRELQDAMNVLSGDVGFKHKIIVLPPGSKTEPQKPPQLADQFDQIVSVEVCMAFMIQPTELGLMPQVAVTQSPSAMNQAAKADAARHQRKSLVPMLQFLKQSLLDKVIQVAAGQVDMQFLFEGLEEDEYEQTLTELLIQQEGAGLRSVDEARGVLGLDPWGLPVTQDPLWASANGVMLLGSVDPVTGQPAGQQAALPSVQQQMTGAQGGSASPGANEGQVNPKPALAQGHMPGTTHVPAGKPDRDPTPSHAAAVAGAAEAAAAASGSSAKAALLGALTTAPSAKAALSELDALGRHVRKGRDPATWQAVHIPGAVMAVICEDVTKGLDVAEVLTAARASLPKQPAAESGTPAQPRPQWLAWEHDEALAAKYEKQIAAAFALVMREAARLFAQWLAGTLPVTAAVLASMIADLLRDRLALILAQVHAEGFELGHRSGSQAAGQPQQAPPPAGGMAQLARQAAIRQMSATGMAGLAAALTKALTAGGATTGTLLALLDEFLRADRRAHLIAFTETLRAISDGAQAAYQQAGVTWLTWISVPDSRRCQGCAANTAASPQPAGTIWPGTHTPGCPAHPACRCATIPAQPPPPGPPAVTKAGKPWKHPDTSKSTGEQVYAQLLDDFPAKAIAWVRRAEWTGPKKVPLSAISFTPGKWQAGHEPAKVERFRRKIQRRQDSGRPVKPVILCDRPDTPRGTHLYIVDGHHRALAFRELGQPVTAYVGIVAAGDVETAMQTHSSQKPEGAAGTSEYAESPKSARTPYVSAVHNPLGHEGLWHTPSSKVPEMQQLPAYVQNTARALMRDQGLGESHAIAEAISAIKDWAEGHAFGGKVKVTPEVQAAAQRTLREWADLRASHH